MQYRGNDHHDHTEQAGTSEPLGDHSVPTSVATSIASLVDYESSQDLADGTHNGGSLLKGKKRATNVSPPLRKRRRRTSPASDPDGCPQPATQERYPESSVTIISIQLIKDTIRYLEIISSHLADSSRGPSREWTSMQPTTQLLQAKYKEVLTANKMNLKVLKDCPPGQEQALLQCPKCSAADEEKLYD